MIIRQAKGLGAFSLLAVTLGAAQAETFKVDVWADNWFAFYANEQKIAEDSVSIMTERSFNAETFTFSATLPVQLNFIVKDYKANNTGLEYIGTARQQMGDGGFIAQFTDTATGKVVAVTNRQWTCLPIHQAPLNKSCARSSNPETSCDYAETPPPSNWQSIDFNDSEWPAAVEYSEAQVRPKDGYNRIRWNSQAKLIWGQDLETDNTLLCRLTLSTL